MPVKTVRKDYTAQILQQAERDKKRILREQVEAMREDIRPKMRFDTGAQNKGVYIKGPGFNDYWEQLLAAAALYESKPGDPDRDMKQSEELDVDGESTAVVGASAGHSVEWEFGLGIPAEPIFLPVADASMDDFIQRIAEGYLK